MDKAIQWSLGLSLIGLALGAPMAAHAQVQTHTQAQMPAHGRGVFTPNRRGDRPAPSREYMPNSRGPAATPDRMNTVPSPVRTGGGRVDAPSGDVGGAGNHRGGGYVRNDESGDHGPHRGNVGGADNYRGGDRVGQDQNRGPAGHRGDVRGWAYRGQNDRTGRGGPADYRAGGRHLDARALPAFGRGWAYAGYVAPRLAVVVPVPYRGWAMRYPVARVVVAQPYRGWAYGPAFRAPLRARY